LSSFDAIRIIFFILNLTGGSFKRNFLIGKSTVDKKLTLIRGFQYKDKEGNTPLNGKSYVLGRLTLIGGTLMRGPTVVGWCVIGP